jgi:hypothetical protein
MPAAAAPEVDACPVPATFAAGIGEGTGSFGSGATMGEGSAFFAAAPSGFFMACGCGAGFGGWTGSGGGGWAMVIIVSCSTACLITGALRPDRMTKASAAWTAATPKIAFARSGRVAVEA